MKNLLITGLFALISFCGAAQQYPIFVDMPDLTKSQAKILIDGMISYYQSNPDSTSASTFNRVAEVKAFIDNPNLLTMSFKNVAMKVVDFIEVREFRGSIIDWKPENDMNANMLKTEQMMIDSMQKRLEDSKQKLKDKTEFQGKYFQLIGMPCPN
jgi:hypothetical protein